MKARNNGPGQFLYGYHWWLGRSLLLRASDRMGWCNGLGRPAPEVIPSLNMLMVVNAWLPERMNFPEAVLLNEYILLSAASD
jgi:hypothetical protein